MAKQFFGSLLTVPGLSSAPKEMNQPEESLFLSDEDDIGSLDTPSQSTGSEDDQDDRISSIALHETDKERYRLKSFEVEHFEGSKYRSRFLYLIPVGSADFDHTEWTKQATLWMKPNVAINQKDQPVLENDIRIPQSLFEGIDSVPKFVNRNLNRHRLRAVTVTVRVFNKQDKNGERRVCHRLIIKGTPFSLHNCARAKNPEHQLDIPPGAKAEILRSDTLINKLQYTLERIPALTFDTNHARRMFIWFIMLPDIPDQVPKQHVVTHVPSGTGLFNLFIHGFVVRSSSDASVNQPTVSGWTHVMRVYLPYLIPAMRIDRNHSAIGARNIREATRTSHGSDLISEEQGVLAARCSRATEYLSILLNSFEGIIGRETDLQTLIATVDLHFMRRESMLVNYNARPSSYGIYRGCALWTISIKWRKCFTMITPTRAAMTDCPGLKPIYIASPHSRRNLPTLSAILESYLEGHSIGESWLTGSRVADHENTRIAASDVELTSNSFCQCKKRARATWYHVCASCVFVEKCADLHRAQVGHETYLLCHFCFQRLDQLATDAGSKAKELKRIHEISSARQKPTNPFRVQGRKTTRTTDGGHRLPYRLWLCLTADIKQTRASLSRTEKSSLVKALHQEILTTFPARQVDLHGRFYWKDAYAAEKCWDGARDPDAFYPMAWRPRFNPFFASPDAIRHVALDSQGRVVCHAPGNVAITSFAFNFFCQQYPKAILPLANVSYFAKSVQELEYVATAIRNLVNTARQFPRNKKDFCYLDISPARMVEIHEAMRTAQPLANCQVRRPLKVQLESWVASPTGSLEVQGPNLAYRYRQLYQIADLPQYKARNIPKRLWLRHGVLYLFSERARVERWTEVDNEGFFRSRLQTMTTQCNRRWLHLTTHNIDILMQVSLRNFLDQAKQLDDGTWVVRDQVGFEFWPYCGTPCTPSLGHRRHGEAMHSGYPDGVEYPEDQTSFDPDKCNITYETWIWNAEKSSFKNPDEGLGAVLLARHRNLRSGPAVSKFWALPAPGDLRPRLDYDTVKFGPWSPLSNVPPTKVQDFRAEVGAWATKKSRNLNKQSRKSLQKNLDKELEEIPEQEDDLNEDGEDDGSMVDDETARFHGFNDEKDHMNAYTKIGHSIKNLVYRYDEWDIPGYHIPRYSSSQKSRSGSPPTDDDDSFSEDSDEDIALSGDEGKPKPLPMKRIDDAYLDERRRRRGPG